MNWRQPGKHHARAARIPVVVVSQLALDGLTPPVALTERQELALALIAERAPISSADLGAAVREARGGRASGAEFDTSNGRALGESLHAKGLVRYVRREGWAPASWGAKRGGYDPATAPLPEGF